MPTFGTSAYLKVICLSDRRQRTELKKRLQPSNGGYDFHGSLKRAAERLLVEGMPEAEVLSTLDNVTKAPERASAKAGIEMLAEWRRHHPGDIVDFATVTAEGPAGVAKVSFQPTFGLQIRNQVVAVHVWNTKFPPLDRRFVLGALSLFPAAYARTGKSPDDLAVLSLRDGSLIRLSDGPEYAALGLAQLATVERQLQEIATGLGLARADRRPPPPPQPTPTP